MRKFTAPSALSRRGIIKSVGIAAAGIAAPAVLRVRSAYAIIRIVRSSSWWPILLAARPTSSAASSPRRCSNPPARPSSSRTAAAPAAISAWNMSPIPIRTATRSCSRPMPIRSITGSTTAALRSVQGFCRRQRIGDSPNIFVVKSELPAKTMKDFVALARANPEKYNCLDPADRHDAAAAIGGSENPRKSAEARRRGVQGRRRRHRGALSGTVQLCSGSLAPAQPHIKSGTLRCLAVYAAQRWPDLPDVPTMAEAGYKDFVFAVDAVLLAPAKTPPANVKWLEAETLKVLATPETKDKLLQSRLSGAGQGRRRRLGACDQGNRRVQGHHR